MVLRTIETITKDDKTNHTDDKKFEASVGKVWSVSLNPNRFRKSVLVGLFFFLQRKCGLILCSGCVLSNQFEFPSAVSAAQCVEMCSPYGNNTSRDNFDMETKTPV